MTHTADRTTLRNNLLDVQLRALLVGQKITKANNNTLTLQNGLTLELYESAADCCARAEGQWEILNPNNLEAAITNINYQHATTEDYGCTTNTLTITLLHNQNPIAQANCAADDGNGGYYFSVLNIRAKFPDEWTNVADFKVIEA